MYIFVPRFSHRAVPDGIQKRDSNPCRRVERSPSHLSFCASIFSALPLCHWVCLPFSFFVTRLGCRELFEWAIVSRRSDCSNGTSLPPKKKREIEKVSEEERGEGESERKRGKRRDRWLIVLLVTSCDSSKG